MRIEKMVESAEIPSSLRVITEANLQRIVSGHKNDGYVILSASRDKDNLEREVGKSLSNQQAIDLNNKRTRELTAEIRKRGYSFIPVFGGYKEEGTNNASIEKSLIVYPYNIAKKTSLDFTTLYNDAMELASEYNQDSILVCEPNKNPKYVAVTENGYDSEEFKNTDINNVVNQYFTSLKRWDDSSLNKKGRNFENGKPQRWTFSESYIEENASNIMSSNARFSSHNMNYRTKSAEESINID